MATPPIVAPPDHSGEDWRSRLLSSLPALLAAGAGALTKGAASDFFTGFSGGFAQGKMGQWANVEREKTEARINRARTLEKTMDELRATDGYGDPRLQKALTLYHEQFTREDSEGGARITDSEMRKVSELVNGVDLDRLRADYRGTQEVQQARRLADEQFRMTAARFGRSPEEHAAFEQGESEKASRLRDLQLSGAELNQPKLRKTPYGELYLSDQDFAELRRTLDLAGEGRSEREKARHERLAFQAYQLYQAPGNLDLKTGQPRSSFTAIFQSLLSGKMPEEIGAESGSALPTPPRLIAPMDLRALPGPASASPSASTSTLPTPPGSPSGLQELASDMAAPGRGIAGFFASGARKLLGRDALPKLNLSGNPVKDYALLQMNVQGRSQDEVRQRMVELVQSRNLPPDRVQALLAEIDKNLSR